MAIVEIGDLTRRPYKAPLPESDPTISEYIQKAESEALDMVLGVTLHEELKTALQGTPAQKWIDLVDGKLYTYQGVEYRYKGLRDLLVPYVYALWLRDTFDTHAREGVFVNNNATIQGNPATTSISPSTRISRAYNTFSEKVGGPHCMEGTLYGFLHVHKSDYPSWVFSPPGTMNIWNI